MLIVVVVLALLVILYMQPLPLVAARRSAFGRALAVAVIVLLALCSPVLGAAGAIVYIGTDSGVEGFSSDHPTGRQAFRSRHCSDGSPRTLRGIDGRPVAPDQVESQYPSVAFSAHPCDPCDSDCKFTIKAKPAVQEGFAAPRYGVVDPPPLGGASFNHVDTTKGFTWPGALPAFHQPNIPLPVQPGLPEMEI